MNPISGGRTSAGSARTWYTMLADVGSKTHSRYRIGSKEGWANPTVYVLVGRDGKVLYGGNDTKSKCLSAIEAAGTTNNHAVIKQLEQLKASAKDRMQHHDAWMNPNTHQMQQTVYLATANTSASEKDDMFNILSNSKPMTVAAANAEATCKLESFADTPVYEP